MQDDEIEIESDENGAVKTIFFIDGNGNPHPLSPDLINTNSNSPISGVVIDLNSGDDDPLTCDDQLEIKLVTLNQKLQKLGLKEIMQLKNRRDLHYA